MWNDLGEYIANICCCENKNIQNSFNNNHNNYYNHDNINKCNAYNDWYNNYNISYCKIVEIAIGKFFSVANYLSNFNSNNINFIATDINPDNSSVFFDDVVNPNMAIYENANIIYSIRPPQELQPYISDIVSKTGAILIIKPLFNEDLNLNLDMKLVNYKKAVFYQSL